MNGLHKFSSKYLALIVKWAMNLRGLRKVKMEFDLLRYDNNDTYQLE